jgi:hypothetical protein
VEPVRKAAGMIRQLFRLIVVAGTVLLSPPASADERVDLFDRRGNRTGYAIVDQRTGRVDFFDRYSNRAGYGRIDARGNVERFDLKGRRQDETVLPVPRKPER